MSFILFNNIRIAAAPDIIARHRCIPGEQANIGKVLMVMEDQWRRDNAAARAVDKPLPPSCVITHEHSSNP